MKKTTILIVEDELEVLSFYRTRLEHAGYNVVTATNGKEALNVLDSFLPQIVATDIVMPEMDGVELYHSLKCDAHTAKIPVLVFSAWADKRKDFSELPEEHFLSKPFTPEAMIGRIKSIIDTEERRTHKQILLLASDVAAAESTIQDTKKFFYNYEFEIIDIQESKKALLNVPHMVFIELPLYSTQTLEVLYQLYDKNEGDPACRFVTYSSLTYDEDQTRANIVDLQHKIISTEFARTGPIHFIGPLNKISMMITLYEV